jgi:hypothetical protein
MNGFLVGYDFYYLYAATSIWLAGGNPYDLEQFKNELNGIGWPASEAAQGLTHPPITELFALPLVFLPFPIAKWLWLASIAVVLALCGWGLFRSSVYRELLRHSEPLPYVLSFLAFPPLVSNIVWGQHNMIPLCGLLLGMLFFSRGKDLRAGLLLSVTSLKPHLFLPLYAYLVGHCFVNRRARPVYGLILGGAIQCALTYAVNPSSFQNYTLALSSIGAESGYLMGASPTQVLAVYFELPGLYLVAMSLGCGLSLFYACRQPFSLELVMNLVVPLSLSVAPYMWNHSFIFMVVPYLVLMQRGYHKFGPLFRYALVVLGSAGAWVSIRPNLSPASAIVPLLFVAYYYLGIRRAPPQPPFIRNNSVG